MPFSVLVLRLGVLLGASLALATCAGAQGPPPAALPPPATGTLRVSAVRQPIYGFGGSQTYRGDALADYPGREAVYQALFGELKLDIFRLRNYHDYAGQQERFERITREFATAARRWSDPAKRGGKGPVRLLFTSWSPPAQLKSNNDVRGISPGADKAQAHATLKRLPDGRYVYGEFADWWLDSVNKFKELSGAYPDYVTIQNELDWAVAYDGCEFLPTEGTNKDGVHFAGYDRALAAVSDRLKGALGAQAPKLLGPENFSIRLTTSLPGAPGAPDTPRVRLWADPATETGRAVLDRLFGVSYHIYGSDAAPSSPQHARFHTALQAVADAYRPTGKPMFQTEFLEGDTLTQLAETIHDTLAIGEASAYFVWISGRTAREEGHALVYYNPEDQSIERRERFYAMKHFSAFIGEGWNRIEASSSDPSVLLSAYIRLATGELAAVLINPTDRERRIALAPEGDTYRGAATAVYRTVQGESGERWRSLGALPTDRVVTLPARSVATVTYAASKPASGVAAGAEAAPTPRRLSSAAVAAPRTDPNSRLAHEQLVDKAKAGGIDLYFLGDSITRRWGATDPQYAPMLAHWKKNFFGWNAANFGWGADGIQNMLWRIQNGELDGVNPKVIVILAGTNNIGTMPGGDVKVADIVQGIRALVDTCRQKAPDAKIILTAIFPRNDSRAVLPEVGKINDKIAKLADGKRIFYLNVNDRLADADGTLKEGMSPDGLHLTVQGYQVWADGLRPLLTALLGPPAATDHAPSPTGDPSAARPAPGS